jgi:hypothetical protein
MPKNQSFYRGFLHKSATPMRITVSVMHSDHAVCGI